MTATKIASETITETELQRATEKAKVTETCRDTHMDSDRDSYRDKDSDSYRDSFGDSYKDS